MFQYLASWESPVITAQMGNFLGQITVIDLYSADHASNVRRLYYSPDGRDGDENRGCGWRGRGLLCTVVY